MLNQRIDILDAPMPLLFSMPDNTWHLIISIKKSHSEHFECVCIKQLDKTIKQYTLEIKQTPFHVGEGIWELDYGCELMTLINDSLNNHPAVTLWQQWCKNN